MDDGPRTMGEERRRVIVAEVYEFSMPPRLRDYMFTAYDMMAEAEARGEPLSRSQAETALAAQVEAKVLRTEMLTHNGKRVRAYWRPEDEPGR